MSFTTVWSRVGIIRTATYSNFVEMHHFHGILVSSCLSCQGIVARAIRAGLP